MVLYIAKSICIAIVRESQGYPWNEVDMEFYVIF